jgi:nitroreductase
MSTLTKLALGAMGKLRDKPARGPSMMTIALPPPTTSGGLPVMDAFGRRHSERDFSEHELPTTILSDLLWCANGVNRAGGGRTAPSALDAQETDVYVALPGGAYLFDATAHRLVLVAASDVRRVTGYQDFVDEAPVDLIYVANHARMGMVPVGQRTAYAHVACGAIAQNVYLYAASAGLVTVLRAWIDREAVAQALGLSHDQEVMLSQTVGFPAKAP